MQDGYSELLVVRCLNPRHYAHRPKPKVAVTAVGPHRKLAARTDCHHRQRDGALDRGKRESEPLDQLRRLPSGLALEDQGELVEAA
jgi:hypothetical protein